jgi:AMP nucleosidase
MRSAASVLAPPLFATEAFTDATSAVVRLEEIYDRNTRFLRDHFEAYVNGEPLTTRVRATYPLVRITTSTHARLDSRLSYGFVAGPGVHETTITQPGLFRAYLTEQIGLLIENHGVPVEIGESSEPIPVHFAYRRDMNIEAAASAGKKSPVDRPLRDVFDTPNLAAMDDAIANGTLQRLAGAPEPLALFRAARIDYSLYRLYHYTGTDPEYFQNFVIFTNYQFYVDAFARLSHEHMASGRSSSEYNLSDLLDEQGRVEAAIECLRTVLRVAPDYADAMFNLALPLQRTNQYAEATDYWRRYLASDCQSEWAARARRSLKFCEMQLHLLASA